MRMLYIFILLVSNLFSYELQLKKGWHLIGAVEDIKADIFKTEKNCIDCVWKYDKSWKLFIANGVDYNYTGKTFSFINKGEGFWVKANKECNITYNKYQNLQINDTYYQYQWNLNPNSFYHQDGVAVKNSDINISSAWTQTLGEEVKVAVIDDCFDKNHKDLYKNVYKTFNANDFSSNVFGNNCHGTEVVGVIGASLNDKGIVGVAPKAKLILISINLSYSYESDFINAFEYAKQQGAKIINCSWGSGEITQSLKDELERIRKSGIVTVFASGNSGNNLDSEYIDDESEDPNVIGVGATDATNDVAYYSNYGSNIDILAPGGTLDLGIYLLKDNDEYGVEAGTSFSAPTVSGAIALLLSKKSDLSFFDIRKKLITTADKIGKENGADYVNGFDKYRAYGKINVGNLLK